MSNTHKLTLYGGQLEVWDAMMSDKNCCLVLPIGSGKSFLASWMLCIAATTPQIHKGRDILYIAPTAPMVTRIIWKDLKNRCIQLWGLKDEQDINNSSKTITFPNGIRIFCLSAETGLKGINSSLIIADEAAEFSEESIQELSNRTRPIPGQKDSAGRMILISTPEGKNAFYDIYQFALTNPNWLVLHKTWQDMRVQPKAWVEEQRQILSPLKFKKDLECDWGSVVDQFYYSWRRTRALEEIPKDTSRELYSFHDFNKRVMCAVVAQVKNDCIEVLKSYAIPDCSTEDIARAIRQDFPVRTIRTIMDMSGSQVNRDTTSAFGITDKTILEKYGFRIVNTKNSNPLVSDTDNSSNAFISQDRLKIWQGETKLLDALETYHYEDGTRKRLKKYSEAKYAHIDGLGDCIRYGIHQLFPMRHEDLNIGASYVDDAQRFDLEPGFQYLTETNIPKSREGVPTIEYMIERAEREIYGEDESWC